MLFFRPEKLLAAASVLAAVFVGGMAAASTTPADSLLHGVEEMFVSGEAAPPPVAGSTRVPAPAVEMAGGSSLANLGGLLPSVRVAVNSRGESAFSVRGAPERHSQAFLDGIPLNQAWDERVDLQSVPIVGVGRLEGRRGMPSLLDGPGTLSGSVRILAPELPGDRANTRWRVAAGSNALWRGDLTHQRQTGAWNLLGAMGASTKDGWPLPSGGKQRVNSDSENTSLLFRGHRAFENGGHLNLLATAWKGEKGVPTELHDPNRYWRYPNRERLLLGSSVNLPYGEWDFSAMVAGDFFTQEIDPRIPDNWDAPLTTGSAYEKSWDRTGHGVVGLTRYQGHTSRVTLQSHTRYTHHREILAVGDPTLAYAQWLTGLVLEGEHRWDSGWMVRAGLGWDHAATPEAGDRAKTGSYDAEAWNLRLTRELGDGASIYAAGSRRSRFPGLRELYSGALGRFVPNPDLKPERQSLLEWGMQTQGVNWNLSGAIFLQNLHDGIEKITVPGAGRQFMRVNRTRIRVPGLELSGALRPRYDLELALQHTILAAKADEGRGFDRWAEDRPQYLGRLALDYHSFTGPGLLLEAQWTGPRWSVDSTDDIDGLRRLPTGITWNVRIRWVLEVRRDEVEAHVRIDNLLDAWVDDQVGLPGPGRVLSAGLRVSM